MNDEDRENEDRENEDRENEEEKNEESRGGLTEFAGITREKFEQIKADFLAATTPELRMEIFGVLLNDEMREAFKRFVSDRIHVSSVVQDYFCYLMEGFDPKRFNRFNDLTHFVRYARIALGHILSAHLKKESEIQLDEGTEPSALPSLWPEAVEFLAHIIAVLKLKFSEDEILIWTLRRFDKLSFPKIAAILARERGKSLSDKQVSYRYRRVKESFEKTVVNFYEQGGVYLKAAPADALRDFVALADAALKERRNPALDALLLELKRRANEKNENKTDADDGDDDFTAGALVKK